MSYNPDSELMQFLWSHPSPFHIIEGQQELLKRAGYIQLLESQNWNIRPGGKYFLTRNGSAILAFRVPEVPCNGFMMMASHSDSPALKIKPGPLNCAGPYRRLNVELYGGALLAPWFDRPLNVAGRLLVKTERGIESHLVSANRDLVVIPSLAIHMDRAVNEGHAYNIQKELQPVYGMEGDKDIIELLSEEAGLDPHSVIGQDLFVTCHQQGFFWGAGDQFMTSPRLDDGQCAWASLMGFLQSGTGSSMPIHIVFDNEEIGSMTRQGAASGFLRDTLLRITCSLGITESQYLSMLAQSFLLSADNAHAMHPAFIEKCDPMNQPLPGCGVVLKISGNQKYATDGVSAAIVQLLAKKAEISMQIFTNHSNIPGGSTLGNISSQQVGVKTADVGIAQLAMHSPCETCGCGDTGDLIQLSQALYNASLKEIGYECYNI